MLATSGVAVERRRSSWMTRKHSPRTGSRITPGAALAGDRHAPLRDVEEVVDGAVERVDDPAQARLPRLRQPLLAEDARRRGARAAARRGSRARPRRRRRSRGRSACSSSATASGVRRPRCSSRTAAAARAARSAIASRVSRRGARSRGTPAGASSGGRCCAHGRAASIWAASRSSVTSSPGRPPNCTAVGAPCSSKPAGTDVAGCPMAFQIPYHGTRSTEALSAQSAPRSCSSPTPERRAGRAGHEHDVELLVDRVDARRERGLAGARLRELRVRDQAAVARHRLRAALEAVGCAMPAASSWMPRRYRAVTLRKPAGAVVDLVLAHLVAEAAQQLRGLVDRAALRGVEPHAGDRRRDLRRDRDAQAARLLGERAEVAARRARRRRSRRGTARRRRRCGRAGRRRTARARRRDGRGPSEMRSRWGLMPKRPLNAAGMRIEPAPSEPSATPHRPAATAAPEPPLEPPGRELRVPRVARRRRTRRSR